MRHNWKYVGKTDKAIVHVDYRLKKTQITTEKFIYIHDGIYPFHDYDSRRRYKR